VKRPPEPAGEPDVAPAGRGTGQEVVRLRERFSSTFTTGKPGEYRSEVETGPVHFKDDAEKWQKIDRSLRKQPDGRFGNQGGNDFTVTAASDNSDRSLARLETAAGESVSFALQGARPGGASPDPRTGDQDIVYRSIMPHVDLRLTSLAEGVKEVLVLRSAKAPTRYVFPLTLDGLTAELDAEGSVLFRNGDGEVAFTTPRPWMVDSVNGPDEPGAISTDASYALVDVPGGGQALEVSISPSWLADPARVFPVEVDPSVQHTGNPAYFYTDATYRKSNTTTADTASSYLYTGRSTSEQYRSFLQFSGGKLTPGDGKHYISDATLGVYQY
jgi:hypothetical protein